MQNWFILDRAGEPMPDSQLPERPIDAQPSEGDDFRPWYKQEEHIHVENGRIDGIHGFGTLESVQERLRLYLEREEALLWYFGTSNDILMSEADAFLKKS